MGEGSTATVYLAQLQGHFIALKVHQLAARESSCADTLYKAWDTGMCLLAAHKLPACIIGALCLVCCQPLC